MEDLQINGRCIRLVTPDEQALLEALYQHEDGGGHCAGALATYFGASASSRPKSKP